MHTNRVTLKCLFCKGHFTAPVGERQATAERHIAACQKAMTYIARFSRPETVTQKIPVIANSFVSGREITGTINAKVKCDARCTGAHGHNCECSCGGAKHGSALAA